MPPTKVDPKDEILFTIDLNKLLTPMAILVAGTLIGGTLFLSYRSNGDVASPTQPSVQGVADVPEPTEQVQFTHTVGSIDDDPINGDVDSAKVAIIEFSDFECPYCQRHFSDTYYQIVDQYIDTGEVIYVFRDYPLGFHPQAKPAALAANCAREQGGDEVYFEYHDILFTNAVSSASKESYVKWAGDLDLNVDEFASCFDSERYFDEIDADEADGLASGVNGTPGFIIGRLSDDGTVSGKLIAGAYPFSEFQKIIEEYLAQ